MPPTQYSSSSPPPQLVKSSDGKVADYKLNTKRSLLQNQSRDQVNAMSSTPKASDATKPPAQSTRHSSGTRSASSRDSYAKGAATSKPRVQPGQSQLTRLGFAAPSSSPPAAPSVPPVAKVRGPGYYSAEAPRTRAPESPQTQSSPQTPKKRVHFSESPIKKENDNYYTPKQQDRPASRATSSRGTPKHTRSSARHTTASSGTPWKEAKKPGKLVVNMDEVQLYTAYSRAYKELEAKLALKPAKKVKVTTISVFLDPRHCTARGSDS